MARTESALWHVVSAKSEKHEAMKVAMFAASRRNAARDAATINYHPTHAAPVPGWLRSRK